MSIGKGGGNQPVTLVDNQTGLQIGTSANPLPGRVANPNLSASMGLAPDGVIAVHKFGANRTLANGTFQEVWSKTGAYTGWLTAADEVRVKAGGNAADDAAGVGAQEVTVEGLDENWDIATETIATAGASASALTTTTFIRVNRAYVSAAGAARVANTGNIEIETEAGTTVAWVEAGYGQSEMSMYTIPRNYVGYLAQAFITVDSTTKSANVEFFRVTGANTATPVRRLIGRYDNRGSQTDTHIEFPAMPALVAYTDIEILAEGILGASSCTVEFDLYLVPA